MTLWDLLLVWLLTKLGGPSVQPPWPTPVPPVPVPPVPVPPVPVPPVPVPPVPVPPVPVPPVSTDEWHAYYYVQPDAGAPLGTPYALAQRWVGQGSRYVEIMNMTRGKRMGSMPSTDTASIGDHLYIPTSWPDTSDPTILSRLHPRTDLSPAPAIHGDEDFRTI